MPNWKCIYSGHYACQCNNNSSIAHHDGCIAIDSITVLQDVQKHVPQSAPNGAALCNHVLELTMRPRNAETVQVRLRLAKACMQAGAKLSRRSEKKRQRAPESDVMLKALGAVASFPAKRSPTAFPCKKGKKKKEKDRNKRIEKEIIASLQASFDGATLPPALTAAVSTLSKHASPCGFVEHKHSLRMDRGGCGARCEKWEHTHTETCLEYWFPFQSGKKSVDLPPNAAWCTTVWEAFGAHKIYKDCRFKSNLFVCGCHFTHEDCTVSKAPIVEIVDERRKPVGSTASTASAPAAATDDDDTTPNLLTTAYTTKPNTYGKLALKKGASVRSPGYIKNVAAPGYASAMALPANGTFTHTPRPVSSYLCQCAPRTIPAPSILLLKFMFFL